MLCCLARCEEGQGSSSGGQEIQKNAHKSREWDCKRHLSLLLRSMLTQNTQDGRCPFDPEEEAAVLVVMRKKQGWPCFPENLSHLGKRYRANGFHEKKREKQLASEKEFALAIVGMEAIPPTIQNESCRNINEMLSRLRSEDASYLTELAGHLVSNFGCEFSLKNQETIYEVLRFMVLGRTSRCSKQPTVDEAVQICIDFCSRSSLVLVVDLAVQTFDRRILAQSQFSEDLLGRHQDNFLQQADLFRAIVAMGSAFHCPGGEGFTVINQNVCCAALGETNRFDITYFFHPETCYLVMHGNELVN